MANKKDFSGALGSIGRPAPAPARAPAAQPAAAPIAANEAPPETTVALAATPAIASTLEIKKAADPSAAASPMPVGSPADGAPAVAPHAPRRSQVVSLSDRLAFAADEAEKGGMLAQRPEFTREAAEKEGRPLRRHRVSDLVIHPQNPRPISGDSDLEELRADWREHGQKDPIHIVPFKNGWGIMEGQRRWLVAKLEQTAELECFEHPPMEPIEVYAFGMSVHRTRRPQTAIDEAKALQALLSTGVSRAQLMEDLAKQGMNLTEVDMSRMLAINGVDAAVLRHILAKPQKFSHRHLYALARLAERGGVPKAEEQAEAVRSASDDKPVSAKSIESLLAQLEQGGEGRRTRRSSSPKTIRSADGSDVGMCRGYADGKIEFKPQSALDRAVGEKLHEAVSKAITDFFAKAQTA